jgi:putative alpha-1,2-mannosidase
MKPLIFAFCLFAFALNLSAQTRDYTKYVNPFIGTGGHGHTFPGATVPFGAVQLSPDTRIDNWDGSSGYHYSDNELFGFSHTHLNGTGIPDYCDILLMPTVGEVNFDSFKSTFSHANEKAEPGFYSVKIDNGVFAELTATKRAGFHRYTFPKDGKASIMLDLKWRDKVLDSGLEVVGNNRIEGFRRSSSWAKDQVVYFVAEFSKPFEKVSTQNVDPGKTVVLKVVEFNNLIKGENLKTSITFINPKNEQILVKVGISAVDIEGARKNLQAEVPDWNFDKVRQNAKNEWNKELSRIEVTDDNQANLTNFYTALYHTKVQPNVFQDVDGRYRGIDRKIYSASKDTNYTIFSLWDTFRAAHPLYTIIDEKRTVDFINTFIRQYEQGGRLPVWELAGNETDCMIGYHSVSVIADAMAKGIKGFDYEKAFAAAKHSAELNHFGLEAYKKRGYISMEDEQESVSKTLEYAYDDWCIAQMAKVLLNGKDSLTSKFGDTINTSKTQLKSITVSKEKVKLAEDYQKYIARARSFENLFDQSTGFMRPKQNGGFIKAFEPQEVTFNFTEGNSWVYSFFVPQDVLRLIQLQGGRDKFVAKLDELFNTQVKLSGREQPDITGLIGQYAHGNEPSHHITYLYNYVDEAWKTQRLVRKIMDEFYHPAPDGLIGNEDCGQMSAWYILSASGFYPVTPGQSFYDLGTPLFKEIKYNLENGKSFTVKAPNVSSKNIYVKLAKLNGKRLVSPKLNHADIINGGVLEFEMTDVPDKTAFYAFGEMLDKERFKRNAQFVAVPVIESDSRVFSGQASVSMKTVSLNTKIYYTVDGSEPTENSTEYKNPFRIEKAAQIKAVAIDNRNVKSFVTEADFIKKSNDWAIVVESKYTAGGDEGLIDGIRGSVNYASGGWQGYQNQDLIAVIDLKRETEIKRLGGSFLQDARPWIWMPKTVEFEISDDNRSFRKVAEIKTDVAPDDMKPQMKDYFQAIAPVKARYVRVRAKNLGVIPAWHPGAGGAAYIFVDEIFVQ